MSRWDTRTRFRLTKLDEWPRHQTATTFDVLSNESPHWSDGYYFTMGSPDGAVAFFQGFRLFANNDVIDAFTCVSAGGFQHNMRWSRRLRPRIDDLEVGAQAVEIVEPLRVMRITAAPNAHAISYDLTFTGVHEPYYEDYVRSYSNGRMVHERSNYDQTCRVDGWLEVDGRRWEVEDWTGVRDHSWGVGGTGGPPARGIAPPPEPSRPIGLRQWCVARLPERSVFWQFHLSAEGELTKFEAMCHYPYGDDRDDWRYRDLELHDVEWTGGERRLARCEVRLRRPDGGWERFDSVRISDPVYLQGGGYWYSWSDGMGRGAYRGDEVDEGEVWDVSQPVTVIDPTETLRLRPDAWAEVWGRFTNLDDPDETGTGHLECVVVGPYPGLPDEVRS